jgi:CRP-like cAMP-binding protein
VLHKEEAAQILSAKGWLSQLPSDFRENVVRSCVLRNFAKGDSIYREGDPPGGMYGVAAGSVGVFAIHRRDGPYVSHLGQPGFWFGTGATSGESRRDTITARCETAVLYLSARAMNEIVESNPSNWRFFTLNVVLNLRTAMLAVDDLLVRDPFIRVASILLRISGCEAHLGTASNPIGIEITQSELAQLCGLSRVSVSRMLRRLEDTGLIDVSYGRVSLLKPMSLSKLAAAS